MAADPSRAAARLASVLGSDAVLVGGLAVAAWGHVRATKDVDFLCRLPAEEVRARLAASGIESHLRRGDVLEGDIPWVVEGVLEEVPFQVLPPLVDWGGEVVLRLGEGIALRVVGLSDLLRLKLRAGGQRDLWDVAVLVTQHADHRQAARELAASLGVLDALDRWLADPRPKS